MSEEPWWYRRCMHSQHEWEFCWQVLREAEGAACLLLRCLETAPSAVHVIVQLTGVGSVCKSLSLDQYRDMTEVELMGLIQNQFKELKALQ